MLNDIKIHGYLGRDPELKEYTNSKGERGQFVTFSVGVSRDMQDATDWFDVTMFGRRAAVIDKFFRKGSQIIISGRMQSDVYEKDGSKRKSWKLIADKFDFCDSQGTPRAQSNPAARGQSEPAAADANEAWEEQEADIPF